MRALRQARELGITELYVKEKLGGLRIQGGGASLLPVVEQAEREADRTCATCGAVCARPSPPTLTLPRCSACASRDGDRIAIEWVDPENG